MLRQYKKIQLLSLLLAVVLSVSGCALLDSAKYKKAVEHFEQSHYAEAKTIFAEILICAQRDERTYELLNELFAYGDNIPLYCSYIGSYGDERLAGILYRALDKADYADFCEISNAIERLGGTVDYDMKDFTSDPTYQKIKDVNKNA